MVGRRKDTGSCRNSDYKEARGQQIRKEMVHSSHQEGETSAHPQIYSIHFPYGRRNFVKQQNLSLDISEQKWSHRLTLTFHLLGDGLVRLKPVLGRKKEIVDQMGGSCEASLVTKRNLTDLLLPKHSLCSHRYSLGFCPLKINMNNSAIITPQARVYITEN